MVQQTLKDGLVLRSLDQGVASDRANLAQFYVDTFGDAGEDDAVELGPWVHDLLRDAHPLMSPADFWVVVDPAYDDKIVSAILLIPQTWRYANQIDLPAGRIELVATDKDYRKRGLIRAQFEAAHARCDSLGQVIQGITGIPHYYRRFGYTMAVDLGSAGALPLANIPARKEGEAATFSLRDATPDDIPQLMAWYAHSMQGAVLTNDIPERMWHFDITQRSPNTPMTSTFKVIMDRDGRDVGYINYRLGYTTGRCQLVEYAVSEDTSFLATFDDVLRALKEIAEKHQGTNGATPTRVYFNNTLNPAVHELMSGTGGCPMDTRYAWYLRVPDVPAFLMRIAPVLEHRLKGSGAHGYTGTLSIAFQDTRGVKIHFEGGSLKDVTTEDMDYGDAGFPYLMFLNVLFGHHTPSELMQVLPEVYANRQARLLLNILFPKQRSALLGLA